MPLIKKSDGFGGGGGLSDKSLIITITQNGFTGKTLPQGALIKYILVKANFNTEHFTMSTVPNGDDLVYDSNLPADKTQPYAPTAYTNDQMPVYAYGLTNQVVKALIIYSLVKL